MRRVALLVPLALALAVAGCLGGGDAGTASSPDPAGQENDQAGDGEADPGKNGTADAPTDGTWKNDTKEGSGRAASAAVVRVTDASGSFEVPDGTAHLALAADVGDADADVNLHPPCDAGPVESATGGCPSESFQADGTGTWSTEDPKPGTWEFGVHRNEDGAGELSYTLEVSRLVASS